MIVQKLKAARSYILYPEPDHMARRAGIVQIVYDIGLPRVMARIIAEYGDWTYDERFSIMFESGEICIETPINNGFMRIFMGYYHLLVIQWSGCPWTTAECKVTVDQFIEKLASQTLDSIVRRNERITDLDVDTYEYLIRRMYQIWAAP